MRGKSPKNLFVPGRKQVLWRCLFCASQGWWPWNKFGSGRIVCLKKAHKFERKIAKKLVCAWAKTSSLALFVLRQPGMMALKQIWLWHNYVFKKSTDLEEIWEKNRQKTCLCLGENKFFGDVYRLWPMHLEEIWEKNRQKTCLCLSENKFFGDVLKTAQTLAHLEEIGDKNFQKTCFRPGENKFFGNFSSAPASLLPGTLTRHSWP